MEWCRLWHDMPTDPKWRVVARRSGHTIGEVIAVFTLMLVTASKAEDRGSLADWNDEDAAAALDFDTADVTAIREAMQGKVIEGDRLTGWDKRQRKDEGAAERKRRQRKNENVTERDQGQDVTGSHETSRLVTQGHTDERREEEIREDKNNKGSTSKQGSKRKRAQVPSDWQPSETDRAFARKKGFSEADIDDQAEKFVNHHKAKGNTFADVSAGWRTWVQNAIEWGNVKPKRGVGPNEGVGAKITPLGVGG